MSPNTFLAFPRSTTSASAPRRGHWIPRPKRLRQVHDYEDDYRPFSKADRFQTTLSPIGEPWDRFPKSSTFTIISPQPSTSPRSRNSATCRTASPPAASTDSSACSPSTTTAAGVADAPNERRQVRYPTVRSLVPCHRSPLRPLCTARHSFSTASRRDA